MPNLSEECTPLWALLKDDVKFDKQKSQAEASTRFTNLFCEPHIMAYHNTTGPAEIQCDANQHELVAVLLQDKINSIHVHISYRNWAGKHISRERNALCCV